MQDQYGGGVSAQPTMSYAQIVKGIKHFSQALRLRGNFVVARSNRSTSQSFCGREMGSEHHRHLWVGCDLVAGDVADCLWTFCRD